MKLSNSEKMIMVMLSYIQDKLGIENGIDTKLLTKAIYTGNTWALSLEMVGIVEDEDGGIPPEVDEVINILEMWSVIEESIDSMDSSELRQIEREAYPFGSDVKFAGFDCNNGLNHLSIARFLIEDMGRFNRFKGRQLYAHGASLADYQRMLEVFNSMRFSLTIDGLTASQVTDS